MTGIVSMMPGQAGTPAQPMVPSQQRGLVPPIVGPMEQQIQARMSKGETVDQILSNPPPLEDLWAFFTALGKASKKQKVDKSVANNQAAMAGAQNAQMPPVIAQVADAARQAELESGIQRMYHGGLVSFNRGGIVQKFAGGSNQDGLSTNSGTQEEQDRKRIISALKEVGVGAEKLAAAGYDVFTMPVRALAGIYNTLARGPRAFGVNVPFIPKEFGTESLTPMMDAIRQRETPPPPAVMTPQQMEGAVRAQPDSSYASGIDAALAAERARRAAQSRSGESQVQRPPAAQTAAQTAAALLGAPHIEAASSEPNKLNELEVEAIAQSRGLQELLRSQGIVDPRIVAARKEAAEFASKNIADREARARQAQEAAQKGLSQSLFDNQEALLRMAGAMGGTKTFGEALSRAAGAAGTFRGEQRKAYEVAEREARLEQNAIDALKQAQMERRVAEAEGDVKGAQAARLKEEEAKANLLLTRLNIQKERAAEADKAEQRRIEAQKISTMVSEGALDRASREKIANIQAAARDNPQSREALLVTRVQAAINASPILKALAEKAKFDPAAAAQYAVEEERLYLKLAPDLLVAAGTGGTGSSTRSAADDILKKTP